MRRFLLLGLMAVILAGCSGLLGDRLGDFRAYYNTFYNAEQAFEDGTEDLAFADAEIAVDQFLPLFPGPDQVTRHEAFERAIGKSANILREHPESKWVDPALMIIGKSYFYLENPAGAEQNFREVIEREAPQAEEAHEWLMRTLVQAGRVDDAMAQLDESREAVSDQVAARLNLIAGELFVKQTDWERAASFISDGLEGNLSADIRIRGSFLLGQVEEERGRFDEAAQAYRQAANVRGGEQLALAADIGYARTLARSGDTEAAKQYLSDMLPHVEAAERAAIQHWIGVIEKEDGELASAIDRWRMLLHDERLQPSRQIERRTHHALGVAFRDAHEDYTTAAAHFDSAAVADPPSEQDLRTALDVSDSGQQAERFAEVAEASERLAHADSLIALGEMDDDAFQAFVADIQEQRQAAREEERRTEAGGGEWTAGDEGAIEGEEAAEAAGDSGFLFHRDPSRLQENRVRFVERWGDRPRVPNWRREAAISAVPQQLAAQPGEEADPEEMGGIPLPGEPGIDLADVPRDQETMQAMLEERAEARFQLGNALFLSIQRPDSAAYWYERVLEEDGDQPVAERARFALAEALLEMNRPDEAREHYRTIAEEGTDERLMERARHRLTGGIVEPQEQVEAADSDEDDDDAEGERRFAEAREKWERGDRAAAIEELIVLVDDDVSESVQARSLYAAARISIEMGALNEPLPDRAKLALPDVPIGEDARIVEKAILLSTRLLEILTDRHPETHQAERASHLLSILNAADAEERVEAMADRL